MHTAMMNYRFVPEHLDEACAIWEAEVLAVARNQPGFVRMQLYTRPTGEGLAIGTWVTRDHAEAFMRTGVFQQLLRRLAGMTTEPPAPSRWELRAFTSTDPATG